MRSRLYIVRRYQALPVLVIGEADPERLATFAAYALEEDDAASIDIARATIAPAIPHAPDSLVWTLWPEGAEAVHDHTLREACRVARVPLWPEVGR